MAMEQDINRINRMLDDLYRGNPDKCVSSEEIYKHAEKAVLAPDMMYYFNKDQRRLNKDCYTRSQLVQHVNSMIKERGRTEEVGLVK